MQSTPACMHAMESGASAAVVAQEDRAREKAKRQ